MFFTITYYQPINQNVYIAGHNRPFWIPTQKRSQPMPSGKEQSSEGGGIENMHRLGDALGSILEDHSTLLD